MDALKMISNSSLKENVPQFNVGDTVKVHVQIKKATRAVSRYSRVQLSLRSTAVSARLSQLDV